LVAHGRWTRAFTVTDENDQKFKMVRLDNEGIFGVHDGIPSEF